MTTTVSSPTRPLGIPFTRLLGVEWTKATDTRAARWLLALVGLSAVGLMLAPVLAPAKIDQTYTSYLGYAAIAVSILLPVVAILMLTSEWSQRTVFATFTQEPRRMRIINAKLVVALVLGGIAALFGGVVTAAGLALAAASGRELEANLTVGSVIGYLVFVLLNIAFGVALGALLQNSAMAITASFVLPAAVALLGIAAKPVSNWVDQATTFDWVLKNQWGGHVPQIAVSVALWVAIPLAAGIIRTVRREIA